MNYHNIKLSDLNLLLDVISHMHGKIVEKSTSSSEDLHMISEELIHSLSEFIEIEQPQAIEETARAA